ncbi:MAG: hypothetical protein RIT14_1854 [Pseudomonadota bacterium]|jgi:hypothetical protein
MQETAQAEENSAVYGTPAAREKKAVLIGVHCSAKLVAAVNAYMADQPDDMTRPQAIRTIVAKWLRAEGYL